MNCPRISNMHLVMPTPLAALLCVTALCFLVSKADCFECFCSTCSSTSSQSSGRLTCWTKGSCFTEVQSLRSGSVKVRQGCLSRRDAGKLCKSSPPRSQVSCCHGDLCNSDPSLQPPRRKLLAHGSTILSSTPVYEPPDHTVTAIVASVVLGTSVVVAMLLPLVLLCCLWISRHGGGGGCRCTDPTDPEAVSNTSIANRCSAIMPQHETLSSMLHHQRSPLSPSLSLLVQESIVSSVVLDQGSIRKGTFGDCFVGRWRGEKVSVRVYPELHEQIFYSESYLYQIPHMNHDNMVTFIAAQNRMKSSHIVNKYLITEHYERGTLADYLAATTLDVSDAVLLAQSAAAGLAHLHREVRGEGGRLEKEAVAHRNVTSRAFWIKSDGTCCLGDLSLAIKNDEDFLSHLKRKPIGHTHYLSPELLNGNSRTHEGITFEILKKADMYAFGLVMWVIARRCLVHDAVENVELPFAHVACGGEACQGECPQVASLEQMRDAVLTDRQRPPLSEQWNSDEMMRAFVYNFVECWNGVPDMRPTATMLNNSLDKLLSRSSLTLACHKDTGKSCQQQE